MSCLDLEDEEVRGVVWIRHTQHVEGRIGMIAIDGEEQRGQEEVK